MQKQLTRLADYQPFAFHIRSAALDVLLDVEETRVIARLEIEAKDASGPVPDLELDGAGLELRSLRLDGKVPGEGAWSTPPGKLILHAPPVRFTLETEVAINPSANVARKGLFFHEQILATQCEAEGFRRITYFPDRPDVLTVYTVRLEACAETFPTLLSNGILQEQGRYGSRHYALWHDPHPKPSYIFALMAGRFDILSEEWTTRSGRKVRLAVHAAPGEKERCRFALDSLKAAFAWEERVFGLEYDLPVYNIVALPSYAGAQENKGLNLFGADGIIADPAITIDEEFSLIRRIIGHEYFHNWTGNRVTCRDWFQLSLKEGLTRLRDQLFMEDELEPGLARIEQVKALRRNQFPEDDGPAAHPVQPTEFVEIDNFYTTTIYDKGAEILRMLQTLVGREAFITAIRAYLERFDGQAVTIDDLIDTVAVKTGRNLSLFRAWLSRAGRPRLEARRHFDEPNGRWMLTLTQHPPERAGQGGPLHVPVRLAVHQEAGTRPPAEQLVELKGMQAAISLGAGSRAPIPSLLRGFSAPVTLETDLTDEELAWLALEDEDSFVAWNSAQTLFTRTIRALSSAAPDQMPEMIPAHVSGLATALLERRGRAAPGLTAQMLTLPDEPALSEGLDTVALDGHMAARQAVRASLAAALGQAVADTYAGLCQTDPADRSPSAMGMRSLRSALLDLLLAGGGETGIALCLDQIERAASLTEQFEALCLIGHQGHPARPGAYADFYARYKNQPLVVDKWFRAYALSRAPGVIDEIIALEAHPAFDLSNTSRAVAYYGSLFRQNRVAFHDPSGKGYQFLADRLLMMDKMGRGHPGYFMAQIDQWRRYDAHRRALMQAELERINAAAGISASLKEVVSRSLA